MKIRLMTIALAAVLACGCSSGGCQSSGEFPILSWGGIPADKAELDVTFRGKAIRLSAEGACLERQKYATKDAPISIEPGDVVIFQL